ncbi:DUF2203 domain-containing protein [Thermogymnomonas acidicola]|uniref:DUF2203 domain-containing protein n=1 Tax=Thermogymnomonas acidicola TaxID=399579 RepID=UPI000AC2D6BC|nr:DUF2203 domain-containing protein [Thermogymnomonas acidicola]
MQYFDLTTARDEIPWLRERLDELRLIYRELGSREVWVPKEQNDVLYARGEAILEEIGRKGIIVRDIEAGLVDFPAVINDMPAYLCWLENEEDIKYWHYVDEGFAGGARGSRERRGSWRPGNLHGWIGGTTWNPGGSFTVGAVLQRLSNGLLSTTRYRCSKGLSGGWP